MLHCHDLDGLIIHYVVMIGLTGMEIGMDWMIISGTDIDNIQAYNDPSPAIKDWT